MDRVWGFRIPEVKPIAVTLSGWEGVKVVQITDLHFGLVTPRRLLEQTVLRVNAQNADLVVLTGDFVCRGNSYIGQITEVLGALEGRCLAVLGNHDHWVAAGAVRRALERAHIEVLQNQWTEVALRGRALAVAGMDDSVTKNHDPEATVKGLDRPALGLTHSPAAASLLWERGVTGVLSGHTHAGQIHPPKITRPLHRRLGHRYLGGLYEEQAGWVYVSAGIGAGAFPWRLGKPTRREIAQLDFE